MNWFAHALFFIASCKNVKKTKKNNKTKNNNTVFTGLALKKHYWDHNACRTLFQRRPSTPVSSLALACHEHSHRFFICPFFQYSAVCLGLALLAFVPFFLTETRRVCHASGRGFRACHGPTFGAQQRTEGPFCCQIWKIFEILQAVV